MKNLENIANQQSSLFDELKSLKDYEAHWNKIIYFCNYRERCVVEVKKKMKEMELPHNAQEDFLSELLRLKMVDDERFAIHFAKGKFNVKHWGRNKIKQELYAKKIESKFISEALYAIDDQEYIDKLDFLLERKNRLTKSKSEKDLKAKLYRFVYFKGYEAELIRERLDKLLRL